MISNFIFLKQIKIEERSGDKKFGNIGKVLQQGMVMSRINCLLIEVKYRTDRRDRDLHARKKNPYELELSIRRDKNIRDF